MSVNSDHLSQNGFDSTDHQTSYIFTPAPNHAEVHRPKKRRKVAQQDPHLGTSSADIYSLFPTLLNGFESSECMKLRQRLFEDSWAATEVKIQSILLDANERTLTEVALFVNEAVTACHGDKIPTGLIVTGPNIASQDLLFNQLAARLRVDTNGLVVILRSGDAANLKTVLKKLIRDLTNGKDTTDDDLQTLSRQNGQKLLNYDLQILQDYLHTTTRRQLIVAFQDSEAFDSALLAEMVLLFHSWHDRIPFVVLFGIATSVELFHERLSRSALSCLTGAQFDVEQTSKTLDSVFLKVVSGCGAQLRFGASFIASLFERQHDHVQSLHAFISALKYAYMCHFYANPLSIFSVGSSDIWIKLLRSEHLEAIRMLPSFQKEIESLLDDTEFHSIRVLFESDEAIVEAIPSAIAARDELVTHHLRAMRLLSTAISLTQSVSISPLDMYTKAFAGTLSDSDIVLGLLASIRRLTADELIALAEGIRFEIEHGFPASDIEPWPLEGAVLLNDLTDIQLKTADLRDEARKSGASLRSRYVSQNKPLRTTVIAQKVQLSKEQSILSKQDIAFSDVIDEVSKLLEAFFKFDDPQELFLHEVWLYDSKSPYREVFTPRPRYVIERALSVPHDYLGCTCCKASTEGLSSSQPPTAILYQLYLETGGLINVFDLWSAFFTIIGGEDGEDCDERTALMLFYRALADLKLMGMVKQSRKKIDHLAKLAWKGL